MPLFMGTWKEQHTERAGMQWLRDSETHRAPQEVAGHELGRAEGEQDKVQFYKYRMGPTREGDTGLHACKLNPCRAASRPAETLPVSGVTKR